MLKKYGWLLLLIVGSSLFWGMQWAQSATYEEEALMETHSHSPSVESGVAVVELFTSEGCSSCPPADRLLQDLIEDAAAADKKVYALSFHVDYWNYLGWKDPYSDARYSKRQRSYRHFFESGRVYTPQMIVNGRKEFVGSNRGKAMLAIKSALSRPAAVRFEVEIQSKEASILRASYKATGLPGNKKILIQAAVVEEDLTQRVARGENRGRKLTHDNVVRSFQTTDAHPLGKDVLRIPYPAELNLTKSRLILYAQESSTMEILGATAISLE